MPARLLHTTEPGRFLHFPHRTDDAPVRVSQTAVSGTAFDHAMRAGRERGGVHRTPPSPSGSEMPILDAGAIPAEHPSDGDDDARAHERDQDAYDVEPVHVYAQKLAGKETPDQRADDAEDDVADEAVTAALHELAGEEAR